MVSFSQSYHGARGPEKRKERRLPLPVFIVTIDGETTESLNWSLGGLLVRDYGGRRNVGDNVSIEVLGRDGDTEMRVNLDGKVVRKGENGQLAVQFAEMSPPIFAFFERCFSARFKKKGRNRDR